MAAYTVTEALVKLKLASKKIEDSIIGNLTGVLATKGATVAPAGFKSVEDYKSEVKKRLDSTNGLIEFRDKLKKAIVESNARTSVSVGRKTMTVAEAIETKHSIAAKKLLLEKMVNDWRNLETQVTQRNSNLEARADQYVTQLFQQNPSATEGDKVLARKSFIENNAAIIVTHDTIRESIERLKNDIDDFETNVDVALSVVNATTTVSVAD